MANKRAIPVILYSVLGFMIEDPPLGSVCTFSLASPSLPSNFKRKKRRKENKKIQKQKQKKNKKKNSRKIMNP